MTVRICLYMFEIARVWVCGWIYVNLFECGEWMNMTSIDKPWDLELGFQSLKRQSQLHLPGLQVFGQWAMSSTSMGPKGAPKANSTRWDEKRAEMGRPFWVFRPVSSPFKHNLRSSIAVLILIQGWIMQMPVWPARMLRPVAGFGRDHPVKGKGNFTALVLSGGGAKARRTSSSKMGRTSPWFIGLGGLQLMKVPTIIYHFQSTHWFVVSLAMW